MSDGVLDGLLNPGTLAPLFILFVILQRLVELAIARRNTARLLARGGVEHGAGHYPVMVALHTAWVVAIAVLGWDEPIVIPFLALWVLLQGFRAWILLSLGDRWTTRIVTVPEPLVARGPYRFVRHPNYWLVVAEIAVTPLVLGLVWVAIAFSLLNAAMLWWRIRAENRALGYAHG